MKTRKILAAFTALSMILSITSCSKDDSESGSKGRNNHNSNLTNLLNSNSDLPDETEAPDIPDETETEPSETTANVDTDLVSLGNYEVNPASTLQLVEYDDPNGYFTMMIPEGWEVQSTPNSFISHMVIVSDPTDDRRQLLITNGMCGLKSQDATDLMIASQGVTIPYFPSVSTQGFYEMLSQDGCIFNIYNFEVQENLGTTPVGGDVLHATCTDSQNNELEGLFTCTVFDAFSMYAYGIDTGYIIAEGVQLICTSPEDFPSYVQILSDSVGSINYTDSFWQMRSLEWQQTLQTASYISQMSQVTSDIIMSGWESRNNTYDILSQEYSDATLGYDRVYDNNTGDVYRVSYDVWDSYSGDRYSLIESGSSYYNLPVTGTID